MTRRWSVWDELPLDYPDLYREPLVRPTETAELRCRRRTAGFCGPEPPGEDEVAKRVEAWSLKLGNRHQETRVHFERLDWIHQEGGAGSRLILFFGIMTVIGLLWEVGPSGRLLLLSAAGLGLVIACSIAWEREQRTRRLLRSLRLGLCPNCRYPLGSLPAERLAACPECGEPWPLVPPPAELAK